MKILKMKKENKGKICKNCKQIRNIEDFNKYSKNQEKRRSTCKYCTNKNYNPEFEKLRYEKFSKEDLHWCRHCKKFLSKDNFFRQKNGKFGLRSICKNCIKLLYEDKEKQKNINREFHFKNRERRLRQQKLRYHKHREEVLKKQKEYREKNKEKIKIKNINYRMAKTLFSSKYKDILLKYGYEIKNNNGYLELKCKYCKKWFIPTNGQIKSRIDAINWVTTTIATENHLYCSKECKIECPVFKLQSQPKKFKLNTSSNKEWIKYILENANYKCEICNSEENLQAHHIIPVAINPLLSEDIDNGICLCKKCHYKIVHKLPWCKLNKLKRNCIGEIKWQKTQKI